MDVVRAHTSGWPAIRRGALETILAAAMAAVAVFLLRGFVVQLFTVSSGSMRPTLLPKDSVLVNRLTYRLHPPRRGDMIVFRFPQADGRDFVKRVIGLPGDVVEEKDGRFWVNGKPLHPPYANSSSAGDTAMLNMASRQIPPGQLFVLGDNRDASLDSRFWGAVDQSQVVGKVMVIFWSRGEHWWDVRVDRIGKWLG